MSFAFIALAFVAAVNAPRRRRALPETEGRADLLRLAAGGLVALVTAAAGVVVAEPFLAAIDVAPESFEIAAGLVAVLAGGWALAFPEPWDQPGLAGWGMSVVPVAFPLLLSAELVALVVAFGALEPAGTAIGGAAVGMGTFVAAGLVRRGAPVVDTMLLGLARLFGLGLVGVGVQLIVEGVRDV